MNTRILRPLPISLLSTCLLGLLSTGCDIEEPPASDEAGDTTTDTTTTGTTGTTTDTTDTTEGTTEGDTSDTSTETSICPGSEDFCTEAESHCGPDDTLEICQYIAEDDCIAHFSVQCEPNSCVPMNATEAGCHPLSDGALIRFLNLSDGHTTRFSIGGEDAGVELNFTESAHYMSFPAGTDVWVNVLDPEGNLVSNVQYPEFVAGHKYTVAAMGLGIWPDTWVNPDPHVDDVDIPANHTRLTLVNATADDINSTANDIYAQLDYDNQFFIDFYQENDQMLLDYVQQVTVDIPAPIVPEQSDVMTLAVQWGVPAVYQQFWRGAALGQVANNESLYVFLTCTGACNSDADRFVLRMKEDSTTGTLQLVP